MDVSNVITILSLAFALGMMHALDADHIMAVTGLSSTRPDWRQSLQFCLRWALGHGTTLLLLGSGVFLFGLAIPAELSHVAESLVGIVLILIGAMVFWNLARHNAHLHFHRHDDLAQHAHWHHHHSRTNSHHSKQSTKEHAQDKHIHRHGPVMVGVLHGAAGSAPLLALIPIAQLQSPWMGMAYLVLFGLGVILMMLLFGGMLGTSFRYLNQWGTRTINSVRLLIATTAIGFGIHLISLPS